MKKGRFRELTPAESTFMLAIYKMEYDKLLKYANKIIRGSFVAEDLVQDTLMIGCMKIDKLIKHPKPGAWLMETLRKNMRNYWRVRNQITNLIVNIPMEEWINNYPDDKYSEDDLNLLYGDLAKTKEYEILKKFAVDGYSHKEIAKQYGISINTCKQRIYRAKKVLQQMLKNGIINKKT